MSYEQYQPSRFNVLPTVVKNLLIINVLFFVGTIVLENYGVDLTSLFGLHYFTSDKFEPYQFITYMFMHGNFTHLFFNMFALWMFGNVLENYWGSKRFFVYYFITGTGAALTHMGYTVWSLMKIEDVHQVQMMIDAPVVGASGAVFGLLLAFGMLFPNTMLYVYFAIPIKAKYFVIIYGLIELFGGINNSPTDNVAHFAHLGGMLFGIILILYWKKNSHNNYYE